MKNSVVKIDSKLSTSKYKQIISSIYGAISNQTLRLGDKLPSINEICKEFNLSRDTVITAYNELKAKGVISSSPGKGYYVSSTSISNKHNVFLLFDELNAFKENLYNSFLEELKGKAKIDIYFHHFNRKLFDKLIEENNGNYSTYVIMPAKFKDTQKTISQLKGRVILLDQLPPDISPSYPAIYQNFEKDTYKALLSGKKLIYKYQKLIMVYPGGKEPEGQYKGFLKFCKETGINHELISSLTNRKISPGEAYILISDSDLVWLVKHAKYKKLKIGKDIGIISYNDTPLKEIIENGITTISTDFKLMGKTLAQMVMDNKMNARIENSSSLIVRHSL